MPPVLPLERPSVHQLIKAQELKPAIEFLEHNADELDDELVRICEIPAPPFNERERGAYVLQRFSELGLTDIHCDEEGNVLARRPGESSSPQVVISAHLDTVFPEGTDVTVKRVGSQLNAPGISDNACGIASLIMLGRALQI